MHGTAQRPLVHEMLIIQLFSTHFTGTKDNSGNDNNSFAPINFFRSFWKFNDKQKHRKFIMLNSGRNYSQTGSWYAIKPPFILFLHSS